MEQYIKAILIRGFIGMGIGAFINATYLFGLSFTADKLLIPAQMLQIQYLGSLLIGFYSAAVSVVFDVEEWSLLKQTITHGILMLPYLPFSHYMGWIPSHIGGRIIFVALFILVYAITWFGFKAYWTRKVRQMNLELERLNNH